MPIGFKDRIGRVGAVTAAWVRSCVQVLSNSVHKSFHLTRRRDAVRPLHLPGYGAFTVQVYRTIREHRRTLLALAVLYGVLYGVLVGVGSQEAYSSLVELLKGAASEMFEDTPSALWQSSVIFMTIASSGLTGELTGIQQVLSALLFVMMWLTIVWLLRTALAGKKIRLRDGLYTSGSPLFAMIVVCAIMVVQLFPVGIAAIGYTAASASGMLAGGIEAMLFWTAAVLLGVLSLYWLVSSFFALIIVTIPGTYPVWAVRTSSALVAGRRVPLLLRILWLILSIIVVWCIVLLPMILFDAGIKQLFPAIDWIPIVPLTILALTSWGVLWSCTYIYLLYRRVVDSESR